MASDVPSQDERSQMDQECKEARRDFSDPEKHYVRTDGWLNVARIRKSGLILPLRYFTLCGPLALDILLFQKEGIIDSSGKGFPSVFFCERSADEHAKATDILGNTKGFLGRFEDVLNYGPFNIRTPFDIINLDFTGNCFPREQKVYNDNLKAMRRLIEKQRGHNFDLFVTFKALRSKEHDAAVARLRATMEENFSDHPAIKDAYEESFTLALNELEKSDYTAFFMITLPKIIMGYGTDNSFEVSCSHRYQYNRKKPYDIAKFIFSFVSLESEDFGEDSRRHRLLVPVYRSACISVIKSKAVDVDQILASNDPLRNKLIQEIQALIRNGAGFTL